MLNLSNYIKHEFIKNKFVDSCTSINTIEEAKNIANSILLEKKRYNLIFECSYLKNYFFSIIKQYDNTIPVINCDSSNDRFISDIDEVCLKKPAICIFDHVNNCTNINIFKELAIHKISNILIC